ncbi:outer membrane protein with beta-barrel domain [Volucribacter psittacicida]|uniref:Outer membrane protein with beta-barrel domain n=1 Tax=Volucribacter psittacicida TaxID=203482 RepID=A0A4R1FLG4_9PAST|nr:outer membrane beta-barrel protein [Volucribacter psittacicida]TCJ95856.1 outer membrane protein with beta-barrel domain [Volucribacter psittacicida]
MKTNVRKLALYSLAIFCTLWGGVTQAATVDATVSWEDYQYNDLKYRNYKGPRVDATINLDNSQWRIYFRWNQNRSQGYLNNDGALTAQRDYQRINLGVGYRYLFNDGWFEPRFYIRQDKTININGHNTTQDYYYLDFYYQYNLTDQLFYKGKINPEVAKFEGSRAYLSNSNATQRERHQRNTRVGWEIEQGLRYALRSDFSVEVAYNDNRNRREDYGIWDNTSYTVSHPQLRLYTTYRAPFGITLSTQFRKSIFGKQKIKNELSNTRETRDFTRYQLNASYQVTNNVYITSEFYREIIKTPETKQKQDYVRLGMRFVF